MLKKKRKTTELHTIRKEKERKKPTQQAIKKPTPQAPSLMEGVLQMAKCLAASPGAQWDCSSYNMWIVANILLT